MNKKKATHTLFVYGTLRKGFSNHDHFLRDKSSVYFMSDGVTADKYTMSAASCPWVSKKEQSTVIHGELYLIDDETLSRIDRLEGHPHNYCREIVQVENISENVVVDAWMYLRDSDSRYGVIIPNGDYAEYKMREYNRR